MSVKVLRLESFGNVRRTLGSPTIRRNGNHNVDVCRSLGVNESDLNGMFKSIDDFVREGYKWNCRAHALRYDEECEPTEAEWNGICNRGEVVSKEQLFMTLSCLRYNSDIRDYMSDEEYRKNPFLPMTFEKWHGKLDALLKELTESIAWDKADESGCTWG